MRTKQGCPPLPLLVLVLVLVLYMKNDRLRPSFIRAGVRRVLCTYRRYSGKRLGGQRLEANAEAMWRLWYLQAWQIATS